MRYKLLMLSVLLLHLYACSDYSDNNQVIPPLTFKHQSTIDSFYRLESYESLRYYAQKKLKESKEINLIDRSYLYGAIAATYKYSYHFDSAVYYSQMAYDDALRSKNVSMQASSGARLLLVYILSSNCKKQQDTMFRVLNEMQEMPMSLNAKALLLDAIAEYNTVRDMRGMSQFFLAKSQGIYDKLIADQLLQYMDSLNLGAHYFYANRSGTVRKNNNDKLSLLKKGRYWIGTNKERLGLYFSGMAHWYCYGIRNMDTTVIYQDSLIQLQNATGFNLNDLILDTKIELCDYYFFVEKNYNLSQQYCDEAYKYLHGGVNPSYRIRLKWMQADIDLQEGRYKQSISLLKSILPQAQYFNYGEQLRIANSIATCFDKLGRLDSAVVYYKQIAPLTIEGYNEQQRNIQQEADTRYLNKVKQNKIDAQHRSLQYARNYRLWLSSGLGMALLSMVLLFIIYRNKRKTARKLDLQNATLSNLNLQLKESNETKSKLFGIISHDLRSPISQLYQLMQLQLPDSGIVLQPEEREMLEQETHNATISLLDSMEDLLIWSKTQLQSFKPYETWVNLNEIITKCMELSQLQVRNKKIEFVNTIAGTVVLQTDANFLLTILRNIIHNAINASPQKGKIIASLESFKNVEGAYCIQIKNQGTPFSQQDYLDALSNTQTSHFLKGGLGLQVVDELSRKIKMEVYYETPEEGGSCCNVKINGKVRFDYNVSLD